MKASAEEAPRPILVIDVGGTHVKVRSSRRAEEIKIPSGSSMTAKEMVEAVRRHTRGWTYRAIAIGYPAPVEDGRPLKDPVNLGPGWVGFDFRRAFHCPVRLVNDAAMQALGSYEGGKMLFLGLGTGLGSAMITDGKLEPMELGHLPYRKGKTYEDYLGARGFERLGKKEWRKEVARAVKVLFAALEPDYVVLGGGNVKHLKRMPKGCRPGSNANAFRGGFALWGLPGWSPPPRAKTFSGSTARRSRG